MFLRRNRKKHKGEDYDYWTLVESVRTSGGPRQRVVASIGKLPGLDEEIRVGWEHIGDILDGKARTRSRTPKIYCLVFVLGNHFPLRPAERNLIELILFIRRALFAQEE